VEQVLHPRRSIQTCSLLSRPSTQCSISSPVSQDKVRLINLMDQLQFCYYKRRLVNCTLQLQRKEIDQLSARLDFVLSFLGFKAQRSGAILPPATSGPTALLPTVTYAAMAASAPPPAGVATNPSRNSQRQFNAAVMSAVYADHSDKKRRERCGCG